MNKMISIVFKNFLIIALACIFSTQQLTLSHKKLRQIQHDAYKDNLEVQNWYYGKLSPPDYRARIFKSIKDAQLQTTSACPLSTPFMTSDMKSCQRCPPQTPLRNLELYECEQCPVNQTYDQKYGNCTSKPTTTPIIKKNATTENNITSVPSSSSTNMTASGNTTNTKQIMSEVTQTSIEPQVVTPVAPTPPPIIQTTPTQLNNTSSSNTSINNSNTSNISTSTTNITKVQNSTVNKTQSQTKSNTTNTTFGINTTNSTNNTKNSSNIISNNSTTNIIGNTTNTTNATNTSNNNSANITTNTSNVSNTTSNTTTSNTNAANITSANITSNTTVSNTSKNTTGINATNVTGPSTLVYNSSTPSNTTNTSITTNTTANITVNNNKTNTNASNTANETKINITSNLTVNVTDNTTPNATNTTNTINTTSATNATVTTNTTVNTNTNTSVTPSIVSQGNGSVIGTVGYNCQQKTPKFNNATQKCQACPDNTQYINQTNACLPIIYATNYDKGINIIQPEPNFVDNQTKAIKAQHPTRNVRLCPETTPYLSVLTGQEICVACEGGMFYAVQTEKCINGCPIGTIFNKDNRTCLAGKYLTNPQASNIVSPNRKFNAWKQDIVKQKANTPEGAITEYCPNDKPFELNGQCFNCQDPKPYFDIQDFLCISCGTGRYYSGDEKRCLPSLNDKASLGRMISNIF